MSYDWWNPLGWVDAFNNTLSKKSVDNSKVGFSGGFPSPYTTDTAYNKFNYLGLIAIIIVIIIIIYLLYIFVLKKYFGRK